MGGERDMDRTGLDRLYDRMEIMDTLNRYATSVDTRDWDLFLTCYTDEMVVDMVSVGFQEPMTMRAEDFLSIIRQAVLPFDSTQHLLSNHVIHIDGDRATCVCYLQAQHFREDDDGAHSLLIGGYYDNRLVRTPAGWRIDKYKVVKTWMKASGP
jgi:3-phenylpropionate/cinnamic acid dioxygenase small subunit